MAISGQRADLPSSPYGTQTTFTATLTGPGATPTGTVTFMDGATTIGTGAITAGVATLETSSLLGGAHSITAVYSGDSQYNSLTSSALAHTVTVVPVSITVASTKNPAIYGDSITFSISAVGVGVTPTGTMTIMDGAVTLGTPTLDGTGKATISTNALTAGAHNLAVTYSGDTNYR
ncbi:MAG: Ig-like domain-containing protein [Edaphobacter sp.]